MARIKGVVKWWSDAKGYGFITPDSGGKDCFVHHTGIAGEGYKSLVDGESVTFEVVEGSKGPQAADVTKVA